MVSNPDPASDNASGSPVYPSPTTPTVPGVCRLIVAVIALPFPFGADARVKARVESHSKAVQGRRKATRAAALVAVETRDLRDQLTHRGDDVLGEALDLVHRALLGPEDEAAERLLGREPRDQLRPLTG